jgi:phosphate transport system substrate-binding protein
MTLTDRSITLIACCSYCLGLALTVARAEAQSEPQAHVSQTVSPPKEASYLLRDGSIYVAGNDLLEPLLERLNDLFTKAHPGFNFKMDLMGSGMAVSGIISGKSAFGPMARDASLQDLEAFASVYGYAPTDILIGWDNTPDADHFPPGKFPPGIWVNARNPVPALTFDDLTAIFTTGSGKGDITRWGQIALHEAPIGNNGADYSKREIHVYLPVLRGSPIISTTLARLGGTQWTPRTEFLPLYEDVLNAVANDPFGIGFTGWFPPDEGWDRQAELGSRVRLLPLAATTTSRVSHGGPGDLYPLAGGIHIMVNRAPGKALDPWLKEYLRLALSKEGQDIIASMTKSDGFIPLDPQDVARELAKLE